MKKVIVGSVLILLLISVQAFSQQTNLNKPNNWSWNYAGLNFSPEQINKIESLQKTYLEKTDQIWQELEAKDLEFRALITNSSIEPDKIKSTQKEITDLEQKLQEESLDYSLNVKKVLTTEQLSALPSGCSFGFGYGAGLGRGFGYMRGGGRGWGRGMGFARGSAWGQGFGRGMGFSRMSAQGQGFGRGMNFPIGGGFERGMGMRNRMNFCPRWR